MAAYAKCTSAVDSLVKGTNLSTDTWKVALSNADPTAKTAFVAGTDDLATGNGYTAGGNAASVTSSTTTAGVMKLILGSPATWTASGAGIGPFRYAILVNVTQGIPVGFWDYGSSITLSGANADTFTATLDAANGVFTVT